ncbi:hypothetical protein FE391_29940 [Nonomuraea sp. KC401]|uniref:hypothetical protein n=1 Tax=unclassified Nonomuraea TaxID=2593643 RepID=UPI0010FDC7B4|nr:MULTISPECIES: hypothetical protein [unclassified Nonomuraea]NBE97511.1 hypothetical protein [Nonomuraea sp. K271]TLF62631.1 hypothetical protein FE391_29940 [Nonomuraea sp. KC401]
MGVLRLEYLGNARIASPWSAVLMADVSGTPDRLLVKVTEGAMWWSLDDRARELIGDVDMVAWTQEGGGRKVRSGCVRRLLAEFEPLDRPEFRRLPDRSAWKGVGRAGMDQSLSAYVGSVMVNSSLRVAKLSEKGRPPWEAAGSGHASVVAWARGAAASAPLTMRAVAEMARIGWGTLMWLPS